MWRCRRWGALYGRLVVDTLHERVGEEEQLKGRGDVEDRGAWARAVYWSGRATATTWAF